MITAVAFWYKSWMRLSASSESSGYYTYGVGVDVWESGAKRVALCRLVLEGLLIIISITLIFK